MEVLPIQAKVNVDVNGNADQDRRVIHNVLELGTSDTLMSVRSYFH